MPRRPRPPVLRAGDPNTPLGTSVLGGAIGNVSGGQVSNEHFAAVGRVVVAAQELEHQLIRMALRLINNPETAPILIRGQQFSWLENTVRTLVKELIDPVQQPPILKFLDDAKEMYADRNQVVHEHYLALGTPADPSAVATIRYRRNGVTYTEEQSIKAIDEVAQQIAIEVHRATVAISRIDAGLEKRAREVAAALALANDTPIK